MPVVSFEYASMNTGPKDSGATGQGSYFTGLAAGYDQHRPGYALGAIDAMLAGLEAPVQAASIGCGTGICCRLLAARGAHVIGIDPNEDMLAEARRQTESDSGDVDYRRGTGEDSGLPPASLDLVVCAQSFHWFDPAAALAEFHRILRAGGRLTLMWNVRSTDDAFSRTYSNIARKAQEHAEAAGRVTPRARGADPTVTGMFEIIERVSFDNPQVLDEPALLGRLHSASYFPKTGSVRDELERAARDAFAEHAIDEAVILRQRTEVTIARRL